jgi:hypothetical protein
MHGYGLTGAQSVGFALNLNRADQRPELQIVNVILLGEFALWVDGKGRIVSVKVEE